MAAGVVMGFLKDLKKLNDQAKDIRQQYPVDQQLANAQASMAQASAFMTQQTAAYNAANAVAADPAAVLGSARIVAVRDTGARINLNPTLALDLLVALPGATGHYPVTVTTTVSMAHIAKAQQGAALAVRANPATPQNVVIDWDTPVAG